MRSSNPILTDKTFGSSYLNTGGLTMTLEGTINKTMILFFLLLLTSSISWYVCAINNMLIIPLGGVGAFGGLIIAIILAFKHEWAPFLAPAYALVKGLLLGGISMFFEYMYPGIVLQAVALTLGVFFMLLMAYKTKLIRATENFRLMVFSATAAIGLVYLVSMVMNMFGSQIPMIHESGWVGIIFSLVVVAVAALNLVLDFDFIESGAERNLPAYMEWYAGFGLMVTLIWLYLEILKLLAKLRGRD